MKVQFFSPVANIWEHSLPEFLLAEQLHSDGLEVSVVYCDGMSMGACAALGPLSIDSNANQLTLNSICRACKRRRRLLQQSGTTESLYLDSFFPQTQDSPLELDRNDWHSFTYKDFPIGRIAAYEIFLKYKFSSLEINDKAFKELQTICTRLTRVIDATIELLNKTRPDVCVVYNELYSVNAAYVAVARQMGLKVYTIQGGPHVVERLSTLTCATSTKTLLSSPFSHQWEEVRSVPSTIEGISLTRSHLLAVMSGTSAFAYSAAQNGSQVREILGLDRSRPIILAVTSSDDEVFAAKLVDAMPRNPVNSIYSSQVEWLQDILKIGRDNPEWQIVIRIHPRLLPNKREGQRAQLADQIAQVLNETPENVRVNWPTDNLSLYDFFPIIDAGLNFRSSAGIEMMLIGIPVVAPMLEEFVAYPPELNLLYDDRQKLQELIATALKTGQTLETSLRSVRWYSFIFTQSVQNLFQHKPPAISALRPTRDGTMLKVWRFAVSKAVRYGPLIRERKSIKVQTKNKTSNNEITMVIKNNFDSLLDLSSQNRPLTPDQEITEVEKLVQEIWNQFDTSNR